jgi:serine/threonine protein kinase
VLIEKPYNKAVDLWSLGIITFLLLAGHLPFDHETSEREIARQTVQDPVPYTSSVWKRTSLEAKELIDSIFVLTLDLLSKNPTKRMTIKELLEHPWFAKINKTDLPELRRKSKDGNQFKMYTISEQQEK